MSSTVPSEPPEMIELVGQLKHEGPTLLLATLCNEWGIVENDKLIVEGFATSRFEGPNLKAESGPPVQAPLEFVVVLASLVPGRHHGRFIMVLPGGMFAHLPPVLLEFTDTVRTARYSTVIPPIDRTGVHWFCFAVDQKVVAHVPLEVVPGGPRERNELLDEPFALGLRIKPLGN